MVRGPRCDFIGPIGEWRCVRFDNGLVPSAYSLCVSRKVKAGLAAFAPGGPPDTFAQCAGRFDLRGRQFD